MNKPTSSLTSLPRERMRWEETIIPSPNSIELQRTVESDLLHRLNLRTPHVAEIFHENSKLDPYSTLTIPEGNQKLEEVREWYFSTAYAVKEQDIDYTREQAFRININELPQPLVYMLKTFSQPGIGTNLLYALDLCLLYDQYLFKFIPRSDYLWIDRKFTTTDIEQLKTAILGIHQTVLEHSTGLLFVVGCAWRYMMLFGIRGYRHTLLDAGRLLAYLENKAVSNQLHVTVTQNFYDRQVDHFLFIDGVERSTLAILSLEMNK